VTGEIIRPANKQDCADIARLYSISSDGVADYIWSTLAEPGQDLLEVGRLRYEREDTDFSYQNCTVVDLNGNIIGLLVAFPIFVDPNAESNDPVLVPYEKLEEDNSYYICSIALVPDHRGQGTGSRLLKLAEDTAIEKGFKKTSLIVFDQNEGARRLYERKGYREVMREPMVPHPLIRASGDAVLMVKSLE
jgi:ribosomal protein S18 acetylase RimI-like enzyme